MKSFHRFIVILVTMFVAVVTLSIKTPRQFATAQPAATWPTIGYTQVIQGLNRPVYITNAEDGSNRLFIVEQIGRVRIFNGSLQNQAFLDISDRVRAPGNSGGSEEGLLSIAFPPEYASKGYFFVYYTNRSGDNQVSRFHLSTDPDIADPDSEELVLYLNHPSQTNHNGGQLAFGPDGYLYIGIGDGGGSGDPFDNAQNPASLLGKLLRIDVELEPVQPSPTDNKLYLPLLSHDPPGSAVFSYRIPPDNPFVGETGYQEEIWALGLRNPWRFSFDTANGNLYIADVGQSSQEEIDFQSASSSGGENYGWNIMEGDACYNFPICNQTGLTLPVFTYSHALGCSVTGGYIYRGSTQPNLQGIYFFADYCSGIIWGLQLVADNWENEQLLDTSFNISSFGQAENGEIYFTDLFGGSIYRILDVTP